MAHYLVSGPGTMTPNSQLTNFFHHLPRAPSISEGLRRQAAAAHIQSSSDTPSSSSSTTTSNLGNWGDELDDEEDVESEVEWDGWVRDLARRTELPPLPRAPESATSQRIDVHAMLGSPTPTPTSPTSSSEYGNETHEGAVNTSPRIRTLSYSPHSAAVLPTSTSMRLQRSRSSTVSASTVTNHSNHGFMLTHPDATASEVLSTATASSAGASPPLPYGFMSTTTTTTITTYHERVPEPHADPHPAWHQQLRDGLSAAAGPGLGYVHPLAPAPVPASAPMPAPRLRSSHTPPSSFSRSASVVASSAGSPPQSGSTHGHAYVSTSVSAPGSASVTSLGSLGSDTSTSTAGAGGSGGAGSGLGIGNVRRIVRGVSIRNAFSTDRFVRGFEDALDFVDGR